VAKETMVDVFWQRVENNSVRPAIMHKVDGVYQSVIWREHGRTVELVACGLLNFGFKKDDKAAIMSQSRPHWTWADIAILSCGGVTVPVYPTLSPTEVQYLVGHSDSVVLFAENEMQAKKILDAEELPKSLRLVVVFDGVVPAGKGDIRCIKWDELLNDGEKYLAEHKTELQERIAEVKPTDLASIVYTSGTTGVPKGVMLLHSNFYQVCKMMTALIGFTEDDLSLSFLPLSHVYERVGGQFLAIYQGLVMAYAEGMETVPKNIMEVRPTILNGVPRFYEKAYQRIQLQIRTMPKPQQYLVRWALSLGQRAKKLKKEEGFDVMQKFYKGELRVADKLVFSKIRARFGGRLRIMVSGAAPMPEDVQSFFETIGFSMVEGYGLTETSAPISCNTPEDNERGTVGKPIPGVQVKIAPDGEIMAKGPSVFAGYYKNPEATKEALSDGWFLTGDIGEIDENGHLRIKDRKKDIIITAGGKHVAPQYIENLFKGEGLVSNILVYGDRRKYITALITLAPDGATAFAKRNGIQFKEVAELASNEIVKKEIDALVSTKNDILANFERIKKYTILEHDFSAETNELTPTFKVKRKVVTEKYKDILDSMYDAEDLHGELPKTVSQSSAGN
jgi:long-chain acyl-CoA synthetase